MITKKKHPFQRHIPTTEENKRGEWDVIRLSSFIGNKVTTGRMKHSERSM